MKRCHYGHLWASLLRNTRNGSSKEAGDVNLVKSTRNDARIRFHFACYSSSLNPSLFIVIFASRNSFEQLASGLQYSHVIAPSNYWWQAANPWTRSLVHSHSTLEPSNWASNIGSPWIYTHTTTSCTRCVSNKSNIYNNHSPANVHGGCYLSLNSCWVIRVSSRHINYGIYRLCVCVSGERERRITLHVHV